MYLLKDYSSHDDIPSYACIVDWLSRSIDLLTQNNKNCELKDIRRLVNKEYKPDTWQFEEIMGVVVLHYPHFGGSNGHLDTSK
jgi:hypothetical protein